MTTITGRLVHPDTTEAPSIFDIGVGLGRMCRFAGHLETWYPVLAHVKVVSMYVPAEARIHALLHDASEAIVADIPSPWKTAEDRASEKDILQRIYLEHGLPQPSEESRHHVHVADQLSAVAEGHVLGFPDEAIGRHGFDTAGYEDAIECMEDDVRNMEHRFRCFGVHDTQSLGRLFEVWFNEAMVVGGYA